MKKIITSTPVTHIGIALTTLDGRTCIAYKTSGPTGVAVLVRIPHAIQEWGFMYLRDLIQGKFGEDSMKYAGSNKDDAIRNVLADGKTVYYFQDYHDLINFAHDPSMK